MVKTAIILAAGYAKRLYPLTKNFPKPLLEIEKNKPVINYIIEKLEKTDIEKIYLITNNKYFNHFINWKNNLKTNLNIEIINDNTKTEETRLGAIGDLNFTINKLNLAEPLLILSADNLYDFELTPIMNYFKEKEKDTTILIEQPEEIIKLTSSVKIDNNSKITLFEEKPKIPKSLLVSIGIYLYTKETVNLIQHYLDSGNNPDQPGRFLQWLYKEKEVHGLTINERWFDIGSLESLEKARKEYKQKPL
ncbi:hypothetical protein CL614_08475 [archaeon]|nr:hypothetical protein [archaeon]|tara:strand:- start:289 stop:1035 length:747 start_codon:yes stop_codon:yes gene_type:complete